MRESSRTNQNYDFYTVFVGREVGVFTDWLEVKNHTNGFKKNRYKGFHTREEATQAFFNDHGE